MNVLILGSGGREHALARTISKSKLLTNLCVIPGNPGMKNIAKCINIDPMNNDLIKEFCSKEKIDLIIPGSEVFLENGIKDAFENTKTKVFGPSKNAARIESSKEYAKNLMRKYNIPTAEYDVFDNYEAAVSYVKNVGVPIVIKYDGLAGGKGVVVCMELDEAIESLDKMLNQKIYGNSKVVIEEYLEGPEFSLMAFVHEDNLITMPIAQDHKRLNNFDEGPNTGGMGIYSSVPFISEKVISTATSEIMQKTIKALIKEGNSFTGFLYGGLMLTKKGPKVIEFNARFGDPEAEVILPKLETDILEIITELFKGNVVKSNWNNDFYLGVVMASKGYPFIYEKNYEIKGLELVNDFVYHMGTKEIDNKIVSNGGRVLLVMGKGKTIKEAKSNAYNNVSLIKCDNLIYRTDIGDKALKG